MTDPSPITRDADALKARHGPLLARLAPVETVAQREAVARLDAAQKRLRGERPEADQMALDLCSR